MKYIALVLVVILFYYINRKYWNTFNSFLVNRLGLHSPGKKIIRGKINSSTI